MTPFFDAQTILEALIPAFDIEEAVGVQLDILGVILGRPRRVDFQPSGDVSPVLGDEDYRLILKAKIIQNQWMGSKPEIYDFWDAVFPGYPIIVEDPGNMTIQVRTTGLSTLQQELAEHFYYFPKPAGVRIDFAAAGEDPWFGYDLDTDAVKGYDLGRWFEP